MVNSGTNAATVMAVEKNTALSTCSALAKITRSRSVHAPRPARCASDRCLELPFGKLSQQKLPRSRARLKIAEDVLDQDDRRIDDDAEVDRADRQEIGVLAAQDQDDDAEEQARTEC